jgi:hypothetical protein
MRSNVTTAAMTQRLVRVAVGAGFGVMGRWGNDMSGEVRASRLAGFWLAGIVPVGGTT